MTKETFKASDIARVLKVSEGTIVRCIRRGELNAVKRKQWYITFSEAANFIFMKSRQKWDKK